MVKPIVPIPYLPDLLKVIVAKVNQAFVDRSVDIEAFFDYGLVSQVTRSVVKNPDNFPLIWLAYNLAEDVEGNPAESFSTKVSIYIMAKTDNKFTMAERDANFKDILLPIYQELLRQIGNSVVFGKPSLTDLKHTRIMRPYWGGGDANGVDTDNLFKKKVDAVHIQSLRLKVKQEC